MNYDLLYEPWIPVRTADNQIVTKGLYDMFKAAGELIEISDESVMYEFGMYRLAILFLLDCFRPARLGTLEDMLEDGKFDMDKIDAYIDLCRKEGVSFDIFDEERPFLQSPSNSWPESSETVSVARVKIVEPSGNNHVHFNHVFQDEVVLTADETAKALASVNLFCTAGVQGYPSTVSGAPPLYCLVRGDNLFETLVLNMVPMNQYENIDNPPVYWRNTEEIESKKKVAATSLLYGMMFPCRKLLVKPEKDGTVMNTFWAQGMDFNGYSSFRDPAVSYTDVETGSNVKPSMEKETWRNIGTILDRFNHKAPAVVSQFHELKEETSINVRTYEVVTQQAKYEDCMSGEISLPAAVFGSQIRFGALVNVVSYSEQSEKELAYWLEQLRLSIVSNKKSSHLLSDKEVIRYEFFQEVKNKLIGEFIDKLSVTDDINSVVEEWKNWIWRLSLSCFERFGRFIGDSMKVINEVERFKSKMIAKHYKDSKE